MSAPPKITCEQELELTKSRLDDFSMQTRTWFWETNNCHIFSYFSSSLEDLTGLKQEEVLNTSRLDLALNSDDPAWKKHAEDLITHQPFVDFRYPRQSKSGDVRHLVVTGWPYYDENGKFAGYRGTGRDETDEYHEREKQKQREQHLREEVVRQRADLKIVLDNLAQSIMWVDSDGSIKLNNPQTAELLGFEADTYAEVHTLEDHLRLMATRGDFGKVDIETEVFKRHKRLMSRTAKERFYRIHLEATDRHLQVGLIPLEDGSRILTHTDITDEVAKEEEIKERQAVLSTVINNIDYGVLFMDKDLNAEVINDRFAEIWKMDHGFVASKPHFRDLVAYNRYADLYPIDTEDDEIWEAYVSEREEAARQGNVSGVELARKDGKYFEYSVVNLPGGRRMATYFDITARKQMELALKTANEALEERVEKRTQELKEAQKNLVEQSRRALLGDLVASLCHELRNPLNALSTSLFVVRRKVIGDFPNLEKTFDRSSRTIDRCTHILNDLYDFALTGDLVRADFDLGEWVESHVSDLTVPDNLELTFGGLDHKTTCDIDEEQLIKAFTKIFDNAVLAATDRKDEGHEPKVNISVEDQFDRVGIVIHDNGSGMTDEVRKKAFEPLYSTRGFGVGLGLPIARQVVHRHGGELELITVEGEGTTITLWFPSVSPKRSLAA